jgi:hypothetical protein
MRSRRPIQRISVAVLLLCCLGWSGQGVFSQTHSVAWAGAQAENSAHWQFSKPIEWKGSAPYQELYLDEEVYAGAAADLSDVRIVDGSGAFVPFYRESGVEGIQEQNSSYAAKRIRKAVKDLDTTFDYEVIPNQANSDIQGSRLEFGLPGESFLKHVQVYGGYDGNTWQPLVKGELYATEGLVQNALDLGSAYKFSHYRLVVLNNAENLDFSTLKLIHKATKLTTTDFIRERNPAYEITQEGDRTQIKVHNDDRLKVSAIRLETSGSFTRAYELLDQSGNPIGTEGIDTLYRLDFKDARIAGTDVIPVEPSAAASLTVVIFNQDDAPIQVKGIHMEYLVDKLVFSGEGEGPYRLLYGNSSAVAPRYDIVAFKSHIEGEQIATASLGAEIVSQAKSPESAAGPSWLTGAMGFNAVIIVVSLLLIIVLIRKLNRT